MGGRRRPVPMTVRAVIVDDQPAMRQALRTILEHHDIVVVAEAGDGEAGVRAARSYRPDVVVMDVRMPGRDGVAATAAVVGSVAESRVLVLTTFDLDEYLEGALRAGAAGFLLKNSPPEDLVAGVHAVAAGEGVLDKAVVGRVMARFAATAPAADVGAAIDRLTEREKDVLARLCHGDTNAEVAAALGMGEATAKTHVSRIIAKLGVRDRVGAVIAAHEAGFAAARRTRPA